MASTTRLVALALPILLALAPPAAADTLLSGPQSGVLDPAGNPHRVVGAISVAAGDTLRVEAGCELRFVAGTDLDVSGRLEVAGVAGSRVTFAPDSAGAPAGDWGGITFFSGSEGDLAGFDVDGAETGVHVLGGTASLRDAFVDRSAKYGVRVDVSAATVEDVVVERAGESGASWAGIFAGGGSPLFERCRVESCSGTGIGVWAPAAPTFRDCEIANCRSGVTSVGASPRLEGCTIRNQGFAGDFDTGAGLFVGFAGGAPVVVDCVIERCFFGVAIINDGSIDLGDLGDADAANDGGNLFRANDLFDGTTRHVWNETANPVKAEGNAWADGAGAYSTDFATIDGWIFDDEELVAAAAVDFDPVSAATGVAAVGEAVGGDGGPAAGSSRWSVHPSPARGVARLRGVVPASGRLVADVHDVAGRRVKTLDLGPVSGGNVSRPLDLGGIGAGTYFVRLRRDGNPAGTARLVRIR